MEARRQQGQPKYGDNDWDSAGLIIDDYLFQNGENGNFHIIKLNRGYDVSGKVTVKPELLYHIPSWDSELRKVATDFSVENSVAIYKNVAYFANSSGLVQGWDLSGLKAGKMPTRVFRFWTGDDVDATITIDEEGMLYVGVEYEKHNARSQEVGQMLKLDPSKPDDPIVWRAFDKKAGVGGVWGTPALYKDIVIFDTDGGDVLGLDRTTGQERWRFHLVRAWSSPVVVDDVLFIGDCTGNLYAYDVADTKAMPTKLWGMKVGGCIESTPAMWKGVLYFADRQGKLHAIGTKIPLGIEVQNALSPGWPIISGIPDGEAPACKSPTRLLGLLEVPAGTATTSSSRSIGVSVVPSRSGSVRSTDSRPAPTRRSGRSSGSRPAPDPTAALLHYGRGSDQPRRLAGRAGGAGTPAGDGTVHQGRLALMPGRAARADTSTRGGPKHLAARRLTAARRHAAGLAPKTRSRRRCPSGPMSARGPPTVVATTSLQPPSAKRHA